MAELFFVARADDHGGDGWPLEQPVDRDLRRGLSGFGRDLVDRVDDAVQMFLVDGWSVVGGVVSPALRGRGLAATDLAGQPSPAEGAPDERAHSLVESERHQLPFVVAADQRVVHLVRDIAGVAVPVGDGERLHRLPPGEVRGADVPDLARPHEAVERREHLLDRCTGVEGMQLEEVDVVGAEPPQCGVARREQTCPGGAGIVGTVPHRQGRLGREQHPVAAAPDRLTEDLLGRAVGVDIGGVEHRNPGVQADIHEPPRLAGIGVAQAPKSGPSPPNVPAPKLKAGTLSPDAPKRLYSIVKPPFAVNAIPVRGRLGADGGEDAAGEVLGSVGGCRRSA